MSETELPQKRAKLQIEDVAPKISLLSSTHFTFDAMADTHDSGNQMRSEEAIMERKTTVMAAENNDRTIES